MKPRLGFFGAPKDIEAIAAAGYDCIEMQVVGVMALDEAEFRDTQNKLKRNKLACDVLDNPIPLDQCIADESFDLKYYEKFLRTGAERAAQLGVRYYIFGNGRTRSLPVSEHLVFRRQSLPRKKAESHGGATRRAGRTAAERTTQARPASGHQAETPRPSARNARAG